MPLEILTLSNEDSQKFLGKIIKCSILASNTEFYYGTIIKVSPCDFTLKTDDGLVKCLWHNLIEEIKI